MAARSAEHAHFLKIPLPEFLFFAASFLPAATRPFCLRWPLRRLPPGYFVTFFFFLRFFFFFLAFFFFFFFFLAFGFFVTFFFFFFFFLAFGFFAFFAFGFFDFFAAFFAGFFFAAVCAVRASVSLRMRRFVATAVSVAMISNTMSNQSALSLVPLS